MKPGTVYVGDCVEVMASWPDECVDAIVTDPPYHLTAMTKRYGKEGSAPAKGPAYQRHNVGFMGQAWDGGDVAPGGIVLDPFLGSGSTALAAQGAGFGWVGIELSPEYADIAMQRIGMFAWLESA